MLIDSAIGTTVHTPSTYAIVLLATDDVVVVRPELLAV